MFGDGLVSDAAPCGAAVQNTLDPDLAPCETGTGSRDGLRVVGWRYVSGDKGGIKAKGCHKTDKTVLGVLRCHVEKVQI
jgi:hypothetical protein